jgi:hypothetical protein
VPSKSTYSSATLGLILDITKLLKIGYLERNGLPGKHHWISWISLLPETIQFIMSEIHQLQDAIFNKIARSQHVVVIPSGMDVT